MATAQALYLLAILGCGEGDAPCEEVRVIEARFQSEAACMAATEAQLLANDALPYPVIVAQCRAESAPADPPRGSDVLRPEAPAGRSATDARR